MSQMSTGDKAAYLQSIQAPELLDKLVHAILRDTPQTPAKAADVIRKELDKLHPPSPQTEGDYVNIQLEKSTWNKLQNINPEEAAECLKLLRGNKRTN